VGSTGKPTSAGNNSGSGVAVGLGVLVGVIVGIGVSVGLGVLDGVNVSNGVLVGCGADTELHDARVITKNICRQMYFFINRYSGTAAERFALLALGGAWILFGSRENSKRGKCLKMPQNPQRPVHALLGSFYLLQITPEKSLLKI
jgi:hypothetical protein